MSFMKQLEEYKEFSDHRRGDGQQGKSRSPDHSSGHSDDRDDRKKRKHDRSRRRSRSSSGSHHCSPKRHRSHSSDESSDDEVVMERCISDKPTPVILARGITEYMNESILRDAVITSGYYPRDIHIARKRRSGHVHGWGFVEFYNEEDARRWLEFYQGTFYMGEDRLSLLYCVPSAAPFYGTGETRSDDWNCARCGKFNSLRDRGVCFRCGSRRDESAGDRRSQGPVEKPNFDRVGRAPCNTILIRELDTVTISERTIKAALYEQQRIASSSIRSCFIVRNPPITETTKSTSACYAFIELSSTHEATQLIDRLETKSLIIDGKKAAVSFARYPFTTIMANIHQWLATASETSNQPDAGVTSYAVTNTAAAVAQAAMMARQQAETERAKRRAKRQARREREREASERGESSKERQRSGSSASSYSSEEDDSRSPNSPHSAQSSLAAALAAASSISQQYGIAPGLPHAVGSSFQFDSTSGYYYDASTGSYFDPKTRYFYSPNLGQWLTWDNATNQYVPVPAQNTAAQDINTNKQQLENSTGVSGNVDTEEMKKDRERREKAKEARRVQKEMEKWAANQNSDKGTSTVSSAAKKGTQASTASSTPTTSQQTTSASAPGGSAADAAFAFMQTASGGPDQSSLLESSVTHLMSLLDWQAFICKLCSRKLSTEDQLRKHCSQSELHKTNASRWCQDQGLASNMATLVIETVARALTNQEPAAPAAAPGEDLAAKQELADSYVYRDRAKERRQKSYGGSGSRPQHVSSSSHSHESSYDRPVKPGVSLDQPVGGVGQKLIEKMGWQEGKGLGRHGQGMLDPIEAERRAGRGGLGSSGSLTTRATDHLDYREAAKRTLFSRFNELR